MAMTRTAARTHLSKRHDRTDGPPVGHDEGKRPMSGLSRLQIAALDRMHPDGWKVAAWTSAGTMTDASAAWTIP